MLQLEGDGKVSVPTVKLAKYPKENIYDGRNQYSRACALPLQHIPGQGLDIALEWGAADETGRGAPTAP